MTDAERPFRSLARPTTPVDPDPAFAAALRERLRRALLQPSARTLEGHRRSDHVRPDPLPRRPRRPRRHRLVRRRVRRPHRRRPLPWTATASATPSSRSPAPRSTWPTRTPSSASTGPEDGRVAVTLHLSVPDVDDAIARAEAVGATVERRPDDASYGRTGVIVDPYGHRWMLQSAPSPADPGPRPATSST